MSDQTTHIDTVPFGSNEPNAAADTDVDTESVFDLTSATGRAARAECLCGGSEREGMTFPAGFPPPWLGQATIPFERAAPATHRRIV